MRTSLKPVKSARLLTDLELCPGYPGLLAVVVVKVLDRLQAEKEAEHLGDVEQVDQLEHGWDQKDSSVCSLNNLAVDH